MCLNSFDHKVLRRTPSFLTTALLLFTPQYPSLFIIPPVSTPQHVRPSCSPAALLETFSTRGSHRSRLPHLLRPHLPSSHPLVSSCKSSGPAPSALSPGPPRSPPPPPKLPLTPQARTRTCRPSHARASHASTRGLTCTPEQAFPARPPLHPHSRTSARARAHRTSRRAHSFPHARAPLPARGRVPPLTGARTSTHARTTSPHQPRSTPRAGPEATASSRYLAPCAPKTRRPPAGAAR